MMDDDDTEQNQMPHKKLKLSNLNSSSSGVSIKMSANSFAAKMMAKMGYVEGQGLGADGRGRLAPIETQLRPQGVGLGAVKEKTKQAKADERREAAFRGKDLEDSSEEGRQRQRKGRVKRHAVGGSGTGALGGGRIRSKLKFKTAAEIEAESRGLRVPDALKSLVDLTGKKAKLLISAGQLLITNGGAPSGETKCIEIARRARRDLEACGDDWNGLLERKTYFEHQGSGLQQDIDRQEEMIHHLQIVIEAVQDLQLTSKSKKPDHTDHLWETVTHRLEVMNDQFQDQIQILDLQEATVAAIHPLFKAEMLEWDPLKNPTHLVSYIQRLQHLLGIKSTSIQPKTIATVQGTYEKTQKRRKRKSTSPYETLIYTLWLPAVRTAITNGWDLYEPSSLISLVAAWQPLLPPFVLYNVTDQVIVRRLIKGIADWQPLNISHRTRYLTQTDPPHIWLFPWLPYLRGHHIDPNADGSLLNNFKHKLKSMLKVWDLALPPPTWLSHWTSILGSSLSEILINQLLPRLADHLHANLDVNPQDQDTLPLSQIFAWALHFKPTTIASLLLQEFFPKFHSVLYTWLISEPNYDEIRQWFLWWKEQIPESVNSQPLVDAEWTEALETINLALQLGDRAATELPSPAAGPGQPDQPTTLGKLRNLSTTTSSINVQAPELTFKNVVEEWCAQEALMLIPLREAHEQTGLPLWRITASANGKGGVVVYIKGDVLWARIKRNKGHWEPVGLTQGLITLAAGL